MGEHTHSKIEDRDGCNCHQSNEKLFLLAACETEAGYANPDSIQSMNERCSHHQQFACQEDRIFYQGDKPIIGYQVPLLIDPALLNEETNKA